MIHRMNNLGTKTVAECVQAFSALPADATGLNLSWNNLGDKTADELVRIFSALPRSVTTLVLRDNHLDRHTYDDFRLFLESMPPVVRAVIGGKIDYSQAIIPLFRLARNPALASGEACGNVLGNKDMQRKVLSFLDPIKAQDSKSLSLMKTPSS